MWKRWCLYLWYSNLIWWNATNASLCVSVCPVRVYLEAETMWKRSEQNAGIVLWLPSSQWSLCQIRHTAPVWQPAALCVPRALWARQWTTGLRSSGSSLVQHSTPGRPALLLTHTLLHSHCCISQLSLTPASFRVKVVQIPVDIPAQTNNIQCQYCEHLLDLWITVDVLFLDSTVELPASVKGSKIPYSSVTTAYFPF